MDQDEYKQKMLNMLEDSSTYMVINRDSTRKLNESVRVSLINKMEEFGFHRFDHVQETIVMEYFLDPMQLQRFIRRVIIENDNFINR